LFNFYDDFKKFFIFDSHGLHRALFRELDSLNLFPFSVAVKEMGAFVRKSNSRLKAQSGRIVGRAGKE
jgi:hypothetical protein